MLIIFYFKVTVSIFLFKLGGQAKFLIKLFSFPLLTLIWWLTLKICIHT